MVWKDVKKNLKNFIVFAYNNISLQKKIMYNYIILLLLPIVVYYIIFSIYSGSIKKEELSLIDQLNHQAVDNINTYVLDLMTLSKQPLYDENVIRILASTEEKRKRDSASDIDNGDQSLNNSSLEGSVLLQPAEVSKYLLDFLNRVVQSKKYLHSTFIFNPKGKMLSYVMIDGVLFESYNPSDKDWFKKALELKGQPVVSDSTKFLNSYLVRADSITAFSVSRALIDASTAKTVGVISIFSNIKVLRDACEKIQSIKGEKIFIIDGKGSIIYDNNEEHISNSIYNVDSGLEFLRNIDLNSGNTFVYINNRKNLVMPVDIKAPGWKLVRVIPEAVLYENAQKVQYRLIILVLVFTMLSLASSILISYGITKPMRKLISTMRVVEKGDLGVRFKTKYNDEIGQLGNSFNNMLNEINKLIDDVYITKTREKEAELNALQAQINPHFIYNTLESIRMMATVNNDKDVANMIFVLGKLLRYSINTKRQIVTIGEEIEHLKNYINLQNYRFDDKFDLIVDFPEELFNIRIIKLVLQPIVENAIYHALETINGKGIIKIVGRQTDDGINITIEDNGIGMTEDQLERLTQLVNDFTLNSSGSRGVGLRNINERIKLYYGEKYGMKFFSKIGKGTVVCLELPDKITMDGINPKL